MTYVGIVAATVAANAPTSAAAAAASFGFVLQWLGLPSVTSTTATFSPRVSPAFTVCAYCNGPLGAPAGSA